MKNENTQTLVCFEVAYDWYHSNDVTVAHMSLLEAHHKVVALRKEMRNKNVASYYVTSNQYAIAGHYNFVDEKSGKEISVVFSTNLVFVPMKKAA